LDRPCKGFSQGQKARVALARALIHDPSHVVLDEPSSGLDVMATRRFRDWIRTLRDEGRCVLFSTHLMQEVTAVCDEVVIIAGGRVRAQASLEALPGLTGHANLEDAFVALTRPEGLS
jgi:sodium transport system ATP-binding protein